MSVNLQKQLGYNVNRVALLLRRELVRAFREYEITPEQWQVLATLWRHGEMNQTQIAAVTLQDLPAVSRMIKRLEQKGYIVKERDPGSQRTTIIKLTAKGKKLEKSLPGKLERHVKDIWRRFDESKRDQLVALLLELREALDDVSTE